MDSQDFLFIAQCIFPPSYRAWADGPTRYFHQWDQQITLHPIVWVCEFNFEQTQVFSQA